MKSESDQEQLGLGQPFNQEVSGAQKKPARTSRRGRAVADRRPRRARRRRRPVDLGGTNGGQGHAPSRRLQRHLAKMKRKQEEAKAAENAVRAELKLEKERDEKLWRSQCYAVGEAFFYAHPDGWNEPGLRDTLQKILLPRHRARFGLPAVGTSE